MTEKEKEGDLKVTIDELLSEGVKPSKLFVDGKKYVPYVDVEESEQLKIKQAVEDAIDVEAGNRRLEGKPPYTDKECRARVQEELRDRLIVAGCHKADPSFTSAKWVKLGHNLVNRLRMEYDNLTFRGMSEEQIESLKKKLQMMKDYV